MKSHRIAVLGLLLASTHSSLGQTPGCAGAKPSRCWKTAETQAELTRCAVSDLKAAEEEMERAYQALLAKHKDQGKAVAALQEAQRAWLAYREAQMTAWYPEREGAKASAWWGSSLRMCASLHRADITRERVSLLQAMLDPPDEDMCGYLPPEEERGR